MIAIVYGSTTGNTENAAREIYNYIGAAKCELIEISSFDASKTADYSALILGCSTWGVGDLQDDWDAALESFKGLDLSGKKVAFFGTGDQQGFSSSFVDSLGILYNAVKDSGADFIGDFPTEGYEFDESQAVIDGRFIGLPLDEDCQPEKSDERIRGWVDSLGI